MDTFYEEDILGEGFQRATISLRDDYEGRAIATLVRRLSDKGNGRSVLFMRWICENTGVHGYLIKSLMTSGIFGLISRRSHSLCK